MKSESKNPLFPTKETLKKYNNLANQLHEHDYKYYVLAEPTISDFEYDALMRELIRLEDKYPKLKTAESPSQRVGGEPTKEFPTVKHDLPMLSLANAYSYGELEEFDSRIKKIIKDEKYNYVCELKIDGVSISLKYKNGILNLAATRGDGIQGDDVTKNVKTIKSLPLKIQKTKLDIKDFEARGEIYTSTKDFAKMNDERKDLGEKLFANPRNSTSGTLKLQNSKLVAERPLKIFLYNFIANNKKITTHFDSLNILNEMGFVVNKNYKLCNSIFEVIDFCKAWEDKRDLLDFETDGVVVKINSINQQKKLGSIAKSPKWAIAFKFSPEKVITKLNDITLQVGRLGTITPVAELEPIFLAGSTISRATLHNFDFIKEKDIRIGDFVEIEKGGDVIPKVVKVILEKREKNLITYKLTSVCPVCNSILKKHENEVAFYCANYYCPAQIRGRIEHFAQRSAMNIEGLGEAVIDMLVSNKLIDNISDIYELKKDDLAKLERMGEKSASNLIESIEYSKKQPFQKVLFGLGIRYVGSGVAKLLAENLLNMKTIIEATEEKLTAIDGIGERIAKSVNQFCRDKNSSLIIKRLYKFGLQFSQKEIQQINSGISNKIFVLTGTLVNFSREDAKILIEEQGGKVTSSVSKKTDFVVAGSEAGSKLTIAQNLGINILNEEEFKSLLESK